jgi:protein PhnA
LSNYALNRAQNTCEICSTNAELTEYLVAPGINSPQEDTIAICSTCLSMINVESELDKNHLRCLNESIWSEVSGVKIASWRLLHQLNEQWTNELLEMMYLTDEELNWAKATGIGLSDDEKVIHIDSNGSVLQNGDSVVLIKDLDVRGGGFTAKRGTAVRNIRLVHDNAEQIEGKINGQSIIILTQYVKK